MSETDYAWAAGVVEGDGSVGLYERKNSPGKRPRVRVVNSDEAIVRRLRELFGGHINLRKRQGTSIGKYKRKKDIWVWAADNQKALNFAKRVLQHIVGEKRDKLLGILHYYGVEP